MARCTTVRQCHYIKGAFVLCFCETKQMWHCAPDTWNAKTLSRDWRKMGRVRAVYLQHGFMLGLPTTCDVKNRHRCNANVDAQPSADQPQAVGGKLELLLCFKQRLGDCRSQTPASSPAIAQTTGQSGMHKVGQQQTCCKSQHYKQWLVTTIRQTCKGVASPLPIPDHLLYSIDGVKQSAV